MGLRDDSFRLGFSNRILERQPLTRDVGIRHRRARAAKLIQQCLPRAIVNRPSRLAGVAVETLKRTREQRLIIGHRYGYPTLQTLA